MRSAAVLAAILAATGVAAESIIVMDCASHAPQHRWEKPLCDDYELHSTLIGTLDSGDRSVLDLLAHRFDITETWSERQRIAVAMLGRAKNDGIYWKELEQYAEIAVRFPGDFPTPEFETWYAEHFGDDDSYEYWSMIREAFDYAAADARSRPLLVKALATRDRGLIDTAICGFGLMKDESMLPAIEQIMLSMRDDSRDFAFALAMYGSEAADQIALRYLDGEDTRSYLLSRGLIEEEKDEEEVEEEEEEEEQR